MTRYVYIVEEPEGVDSVHGTPSGAVRHLDNLARQNDGCVQDLKKSVDKLSQGEMIFADMPEEYDGVLSAMRKKVL